MDITTRATARQLQDAIGATGIKAPPAVTAAFERVTRVSAAARGLGVRDGQLYAAVAAALYDGRDPAAEPEVQRILTANQIANEGVGMGVDELVYGDLRTVLREHADTIVKAWRKSFDVAAEVLVAAHQRIGDLPLSETDSIMRKGGDIASTWAQAQGVVGTLSAIAAGWASLGMLTGQAPDPRRHRVLRIADIDPAAYLDADLEGAPVDPWQLVLDGYPLDLPTLAEYDARVQAVHDEQAHRQAHASATNTAALMSRRPPVRVM